MLSKGKQTNCDTFTEWNIVHLTDLQVNTCVLSQKHMLREKRQVAKQYEQCDNYSSF